MKKLCIYLFLVLFSLQTPSQADDIRDFQIEGMSVGDSLLDYFSEDEIKERILQDYPGSDKYKRFFSWDPESYEVYQGVQVNFKKNDKKYIIESTTGEIKYPKGNIEDCYQLMSEIENEISSIFPDTKKRSEKDVAKLIDPTGASRQSSADWRFPSGDGIQVSCSDFSEEFTKKRKNHDNLSVAIDSKVFIDFLQYEAYK